MNHERGIAAKKLVVFPAQLPCHVSKNMHLKDQLAPQSNISMASMDVHAICFIIFLLYIAYTLGHMSTSLGETGLFKLFFFENLQLSLILLGIPNNHNMMVLKITTTIHKR